MKIRTNADLRISLTERILLDIKKSTILEAYSLNPDEFILIIQVCKGVNIQYKASKHFVEVLNDHYV
jgi:hypothetical protein